MTYGEANLEAMRLVSARTPQVWIYEARSFPTYDATTNPPAIVDDRTWKAVAIVTKTATTLL